MFTLSVNGMEKHVDVDPETPLLWVLRDNLGFTSVKYTCGIAECGMCTVLIDGVARRSCIVPVEEVGQSEITTMGWEPPATPLPVSAHQVEPSTDCMACHR